MRITFATDHETYWIMHGTLFLQAATVELLRLEAAPLSELIVRQMADPFSRIVVRSHSRGLQVARRNILSSKFGVDAVAIFMKVSHIPGNDVRYLSEFNFHWEFHWEEKFEANGSVFSSLVWRPFYSDDSKSSETTLSRAINTCLEPHASLFASFRSGNICGRRLTAS